MTTILTKETVDRVFYALMKAEAERRPRAISKPMVGDGVCACYIVAEEFGLLTPEVVDTIRPGTTTEQHEEFYEMLRLHTGFPVSALYLATDEPTLDRGQRTDVWRNRTWGEVAAYLLSMLHRRNLPESLLPSPAPIAPLALASA
jgi:hypothetical protein